MTYKKVGGLHFFKCGRFGFSLFWSRSNISRAAERRWRRTQRRAELAAARHAQRTADRELLLGR